MIKTVEAVIDEQGNVSLLEPVQLPKPQRAFVAISDMAETALLSEAALAEGWSRPEEDAAWAPLLQNQSS